MGEFIPYLLRSTGTRVLHIGNNGVPLCGVLLGTKVERFFLPPFLGPAHGVCGECKAIYERSKEHENRDGRAR